jgi:cytochrome c
VSSAAPTSRAPIARVAIRSNGQGRAAFSEAPPFRTLHHKYPVETLEEVLAEGIFTGHPAMPEFQLRPRQIGDFIAFLKSLE